LRPITIQQLFFRKEKRKELNQNSLSIAYILPFLFTVAFIDKELHTVPLCNAALLD